MPRAPLPTFDLANCESTAWCVAICPTQCLDMWNDQPGLKFPAACVSCAACEFVCPTKAVRVIHAAPARPFDEVHPETPDGSNHDPTL